jgi:hypothetical protein
MSPNAETVTLSMYYAYKARAAKGVSLDKAITFGLDFPGLRPVLNELVRFGVVRSNTIDTVQLSLSFISHLDNESKQRAQKRAEENENDAKANVEQMKQWRHEWRIALVSACASSILTLLIEHFTEILVFIKEFFH